VGLERSASQRLPPQLLQDPGRHPLLIRLQGPGHLALDLCHPLGPVIAADRLQQLGLESSEPGLEIRERSPPILAASAVA